MVRTDAMIRSVVFLSVILIGLGVASGLICAVIALVGSDGIEPRVELVGTLYYSLAVLFPAALWVGLYLTQDADEYKTAYASPLYAVVTTVQGAAIGGILGAGPAFLAVAANVPLLLGLESDTFAPMLRNMVIWARLGVVAAAVTLCAIPLGLWTHYTGAFDDSA